MSEVKQEYITAAEAATYLGAKPATLKKWYQGGLIPYYKVTCRPRFKISELEAFMQSRRVEAVRRRPPRQAEAAKVINGLRRVR